MYVNSSGIKCMCINGLKRKKEIVLHILKLDYVTQKCRPFLL